MKITKKELIERIDNKITELKNFINVKTERWLKINNDKKEAQKLGAKRIVASYNQMLEELDEVIAYHEAQLKALESLYIEDFFTGNIVKIEGAK